MTAARMKSVQCISPAGLHRMAYKEWGDPANTKVLVCVHGVTRVGDDFDALAQALSDHYRVVCPDVVGRGRSGKLRNPLLYQIPLRSNMVTRSPGDTNFPVASKTANGYVLFPAKEV